MASGRRFFFLFATYLLCVDGQCNLVIAWKECVENDLKIFEFGSVNGRGVGWCVWASDPWNMTLNDWLIDCFSMQIVMHINLWVNKHVVVCFFASITIMIILLLSLHITSNFTTISINCDSLHLCCDFVICFQSLALVVANFATTPSCFRDDYWPSVLHTYCKTLNHQSVNAKSL